MRSRYTAFALGDARHLLDTWFPATRPDDLTLDPGTSWTRLDFLGAETAADGRSGRVSFRAHWLESGTVETGALEEDSRFVRHSGRWYYVSAL
ncbi:hypothetical protein MMM2322_01145 [Microbacterium sp. MM2322]